MNKFHGHYWSHEFGAWVPMDFKLKPETVGVFSEANSVREQKKEDAVRRILELSEELHLTVGDLEEIFRLVKSRSHVSSFFLTSFDENESIHIWLEKLEQRIEKLERMVLIGPPRQEAPQRSEYPAET